MAENAAGELRKTKQELAKCRRALSEAEAFNERLRSAIGYDELEGWQPQRRIEQQYGWVFAWLYPLTTFLERHVNHLLTPDIRNEIHNIVTAIIAQMAVQGKYGVRLPHDPRPTDISQFIKKQNQSFYNSYEPCVICGEDRITHECHILPRADGGPFHKDNLLTLCPLHHHLFDHSRLSRAEWDAVASLLPEKSEAARVYALEVRLPEVRAFWKQCQDE